jgi:LacI family transcriptional regulator
VTIKDIAREAKVSIATVSNVINNKGRVSEETRRLVQSLIDKYNYTPDLSARSLKNKHSHLISVVVPYLAKGEFEDNPYFWQVVSGIESGASSENFHVMLTGISDSPDMSFATERHLDGLVVIGASEQADHFQHIMDLNLPCVFMDSYITKADVYQVYSNDKFGGYLGTKYLVSLGYEKIILVSGIKGKIAEGSGVDYQRWLGYKQALAEAGIEYNPELVIEEGNTMLGGYYAAQKVIGSIDRKTAIFVLSDIGAMGLIRGLNELGISVPKDVSVVGYDDIFYADFMVPSLTTIRQDIFRKGERAVDLLLAQIEKREIEAKTILLPVELKIRESTTKNFSQ